MDILKIGDIRRFDNDIIGVVSGVSNNVYEIIDSNGVRKNISMESSISIPKLKPELRSYLSTIANELKYCHDMKVGLAEAEKSYRYSLDRVNNLINGLKSFDTQMNLKAFEDAVYNNLGKGKLGLIKDRGYVFKFSYNAHSLDIKLFYKTLVKMKANSKNTDYIDDWGKEGLKFKYFADSYDKEVERYSHLCIPFITEGLKGVLIADKKCLSIEDKTTIMFNHCVHYCFLGVGLTQETAANVAQSIKVQGRWGD